MKLCWGVLRAFRNEIAVQFPVIFIIKKFWGLEIGKLEISKYHSNFLKMEEIFCKPERGKLYWSLARRDEPEEGGFTLLEEEVMVIRTPYGLTEIKACEHNAFHFLMALIFWYNRPMRWHFSRHFIHLVAWLFYICPDCRSAKSHPYSFLSLDDLNSFFTEKIEAMRGNLHVLAPKELSLALHLWSHSLPFSSPGDELSCSDASPAPLPVLCTTHSLLLFPGQPTNNAPSFSDPQTYKIFSLWIHFLWLFPFFPLDKTPWKSCICCN